MSRRALCLWLLAGSVCVALAAGGAGLAQQSGPGAPPPDPPSVPSADVFNLAQGGAAAVSRVGAEDETSKPARRPPREGTGFGGSYGGGGAPSAAAGVVGAGGWYGGAAAPYSAVRAGGGGGGYSGGVPQYGNARYGVQPGGGYSGYFTYGKARSRKPDPEMEKLLKEDAKMEAHALSLVKQWREETDVKAKGDLRAELQELTKEHFDLRQKRRELELSRLEEQLERVRASIKKRNEVKDLIIQRRMARLLGEEDDLAF